ncbi:MAG: alpha/beta fold hydrolase [Actinomycetota bacterium]
MDRVAIGGLSIAFERRGAGAALVLLHGGLSDHREWRPQLDGLADAFTVIAWDAPGCGGSTDPPGAFRMPQYADVLADFIDALGLVRPHVAGLSWGSALALELYRRRPDIPRTLVLASAYAGWAGSLPADVVAERLRGSLDALARPPEEVARSFASSLFSDRVPPAVVEEAVAIMAGFRRSGAEPMLRAMAEADLRDVLSTIDVPTLLLYGEEDERSPTVVAHELLEAIPGSTLVMLPAAGHQCNLEAADRCNGAIRDFLTEREEPPDA